MTVAAAVILAMQTAGPSRPPDIPFRSHAVDLGASETAAVADLNRDGRLDIVSGEHWYEAPAWTQHRFREVGFTSNYIDSFSVLPLDVDGDNYMDIVDVSWFARKVAWWRNPGRTEATSVPERGATTSVPERGRRSFWTETLISSGGPVEFAVLTDMDNDGRQLEVVAQQNGTPQAWFEARDGRWVSHLVSDRTYGHGIGCGDVNRDGRNDILTPRGWLEAPSNPRDGNWTFHGGLATANMQDLGFMHVLDVNGDGRNDIISAAGHDFGVFWFEQSADDQWTRRTIDNAWSQGHASTLIDLNGDGRLDLVTGKRFMAHNGSDPGERDPLGLYWYEFRPAAGRGGGVEWIRHVIDYGGRVGAGMQINVIDMDRDGDLDLVVGGKSGLFLLENLTKNSVPHGKEE